MRKGFVLLLAVLLCAVLFVSCSQDKNRAVIYFNSNGGIGHMSPQNVTKSEATTLNANEYTRIGWHFDYWSTTAEGMGHHYKDGESITVEQDTTLYAQWTENTYTVKFKPGAGSGTMDDQKDFKYHTPKKLSKCTFTGPTDMFFLNWKVEGKEQYYMDEAEVDKLTAEDGGVVTLEAHWGQGFAYRMKLPFWDKTLLIYRYKKCTINVSEVTKLNAPFTELEEGWYAIETDITVTERIEVKGDVHLILCDGTTLNAPKGINVGGSDKLTIYDQGLSDNPIGKIVINNTGEGIAGIGGGSNGNPSGKIIIHGGDLDIRMPQGGGAGIGGNSDSSNGDIRILGGKIHVEGGGYSSAIGGGYATDSGNIDILGGNVEALGTLGAGIGAGLAGNNGGLIIIGGDAVVNAEGGKPLESSSAGEASAGIGGANERNGGTIRIIGGTITAKGGFRPEFEEGPAIKGAGIGGGNIDNKDLNGTLQYDSNIIKIQVSSDGTNWEDYNGTDRKQYMKTYVVN